MHEPGYLDALRRVDGEPVTLPDFAPPGLEPDIPVDASARRRRPRGGADGDHRGRSGSPAAPTSPTPSAARPATTPAPTSSAATATSTTPPPPCGRWPRPACGRSACSTSTSTTRTGPRPWSSAMEGATLHSLHASPVTNVAAGTVLPQSERERVVAFGASPDADAYLHEVGGLDRGAERRRRGPGRLARLRHRRRRPARVLGLRAGDLHRRRPPPGRLGAAGLRDPGGRLLAAGCWPSAATPSPPACSEGRRG